MTKEEISEYTLRISQANNSQLVVVMYDVILKYLNDSLVKYKDNNSDEFIYLLRKAQKMHQELMNTLSFSEKICFDVMQLYLYVNKNIIMSIIKLKPYNLESSIIVMNNLRKGFDGLAKKDFEEPIMRNTHKVYLGLTYGPGCLNETMDALDQNNRGFMA